jgi:type I restriction enzyme S subunit
VPIELDGAIVSNDFPSFEFRDLGRCDPAFMGWLVRSAPFVELCRAASEGTTNRVRIKEDRFLIELSVNGDITTARPEPSTLR